MSSSAANPERIRARLFTDPSSPAAYSANPAFRTIEWRYRDQIEWHLVMTGRSEPGSVFSDTPAELAESMVGFRDRYGMPFEVEAKIRHTTSARACQAIIAAGLINPGSEWRALRTLQLMEFNTPILLDEDDHLMTALESVPGLDPLKVVLAIDTPEVQSAYRAARTESRHPAPTVVFSREGRQLKVGGLQPAGSYQMAVTGLDPGLVPTGPPEDPLEVLQHYSGGLATQEVAAIMAPGPDRPDREGTGRMLFELLSEGKLKRIPMGDDAIWLADQAILTG